MRTASGQSESGLSCGEAVTTRIGTCIGVGIRPQLAAEIAAVEVGQAVVEDDQIRNQFLGAAERIAPVQDRQRADAAEAERFTIGIRRIRLVFHDQRERLQGRRVRGGRVPLQQQAEIFGFVARGGDRGGLLAKEHCPLLGPKLDGGADARRHHHAAHAALPPDRLTNRCVEVRHQSVRSEVPSSGLPRATRAYSPGRHFRLSPGRTQLTCRPSPARPTPARSR